MTRPDAKAWEGHTPGPWVGPTEPHDSVPYLHLYGPDGKSVMHEDRPFAEKMANAALQRAAPSLAARVQELEAGKTHWHSKAAMMSERVEELEAALTEIHGIAMMFQIERRERLKRIKARVRAELEVSS